MFLAGRKERLTVFLEIQMLVFDINLCGINEKALLATSGISDPSLRMMSIARIQCSDSIKKFGVVGFDLLTQTADGQFLSASLFVTDGNRDVMKKALGELFQRFNVVRYCISMEAGSVELGKGVLIGQFEPDRNPKAWLFKIQKLKRDPFAQPFHIPERVQSFWGGLLDSGKAS